MKTILMILLIGLISQSASSWAQTSDSIFATINLKNVLLYENPTTSSPIVRRVFVGEVLKITEIIKGERGEIWGKVFLSPQQVGYIQGVYFNNSGSLQQEIWKPQVVLRSEMPFSFALKGTSELFGPGIQFRYLPFARLGLTVGAGTVLDQGQMKGSSLAYGLVCVLSMGNFSPFVETGSSTLTFNDSHSTLRISTFYINAGVEWILPAGYYFGLGASYNRSYDVQVSFDYGYAKATSGSLAVGDYGSFNKVNGASSLQQLNPLFIAGYSF